MPIGHPCNTSIQWTQKRKDNKGATRMVCLSVFVYSGAESRTSSFNCIIVAQEDSITDIKQQKR